MPSVKRTHHRRPLSAKASVSGDLLVWFDVNRRELAWRAKAGERCDPYRVWLSEIMLQQTTVAAIAPYYRAFLQRWPSVKHLAGASQDEVLGAWAGLGYYSRARNLHRAANVVVKEWGAAFPTNSAELRTLPGIGAYTAAAIASIAFSERVAAMDANAERVVARLFAVEEPLPKVRARLAALATPLVPEQRPGDFAQALMDLGSMICVPKRPRCGGCPLAAHCKGRAMGIAEDLPRKVAKAARPLKRGAAFVALDAKGAVYLVRRAEEGLLGAMLQPPLGPWTEKFPKLSVAVEEAPFIGDWVKKPGFVRHGFTHFQLEMEVYVARFRRRPNGEGRWFAAEEMATAALPTVMKKVIAHALDEHAPLLARLSSPARPAR